MHFSRNTWFSNNRSVWGKLLIPAGCMAAFMLLLQFGMGLAASSQSPNSLAYKPLSEIPAEAEQVQTGIYAANLYDLNPSSNTYYLDYYMWFKWKGDIDPIANLEFTNGVEDWSVTQVPGYEEPEELPDGSFYQVIRTEGRYRESFELVRYPLDQQNLGVTIENSVYTTDQLVYVADTENSGYADDLAVPGWKIKGHQLKTLVHEYASNFGDPRLGNERSTYAALRYELLISRPVSFFIWKLLLPLLIVLLSSWGALLLYPLYTDSRIILPVTALLTTVFLQQSYSDSLPDVGYLVLLDKIYAIAYVLIIGAILEAIVTADLAKSEKPEAIAQVVRIDRYFLLGSSVSLIGGVVLLILLT